MATTLYLVSAETPQGEGYWKVGVTAKADPLKRNPKAYREVFRAQVFESAEVAKDVELAVAKVFKALAPTPYGRETLAYSAGLEVAAAVFDFCFEERLRWEAPPWPDTDEESSDRDYVRYCVAATHFCRRDRPGMCGCCLAPWGETVRIGKLEAHLAQARLELSHAEHSYQEKHARRELQHLPDCVLPEEEAAYRRYFDMVEACQKVIDAVVVAKPALEPMWA